MGIAPILTDQRVENVWRTADMACWNWGYHKVRNATLLRKEQFVERDDGVRFPAPELRPDLGIPSNDSTSVKAGVSRTIPECVMVPASLRSTRHIWVRGRNAYMPWHGFWELSQPLISVEFNVPLDPAPSILAPATQQ